MNKFRHLLSNINLLNCLLMLTVVAVASAVLPLDAQNNDQTPLAAIASRYMRDLRTPLPEAGKPEIAALGIQTPLPIPAHGDYNIVSEQNLFHAERRIPAEKKDVVVAVIPKPDLILYGTLITPDLSIAFIEDRKAPYSTDGHGKRQTQVKKGEMLNGYVIQNIEPDRMVLAKGEEQITVLLNDTKNRKGGETPAPAPAGSQPGVAQGTAGLPAPPRAATASAATSPSPATTGAATPAAATAQAATTSTGQTAAASSSSSPATGAANNTPLPFRLMRRGR